MTLSSYCFAIITVFLFIIICHLLSPTWEVVQTVFTFNFLFLIILLPLKGHLTRKIAILLVGNILSFLWSTIFYLLVRATAGQIQGAFNVFYVILGPMLNILWTVAFWSTSLTFLAGPKSRKRWKV